MKSTIFGTFHALLLAFPSHFYFLCCTTISKSNPNQPFRPNRSGHVLLAIASFPKLDEFQYHDCPVFGAAYQKQLRALTKAAADPAKGAIAEASTFFSAYAAWRSSEEATRKCAEAVPPDDATDEERAWFRALFMLLTRAPASGNSRILV